MTATLLQSPEQVASLVYWSCATRNIPGDVAELGVYQGGSAWVLSVHNPGRHLYLFDTFTGLPEPQQGVDQHAAGDFADTTLELVKQTMRGQDNVIYVQGLFPGSAAPYDDLRFKLVHLDADLYESTKAGLEWFWHRLHRGGALILHDYQWPQCPGVAKAAEELAAQFPGQGQWFTHVQYQLVIKKCR